MTTEELRQCTHKQLQMLAIHAANSRTREAAARELQERKKRN